MLDKLVNLIILLTAVVYSNCEEVSNDNLIAVVVTHRHGERNIFHRFENDEYADEKYWVEGFGELRKLGKQHHYALGQWFRKYYEDFIPECYNPKDIRIQSTDVDRTLMSVSSHLAGMFPPVKNDNCDQEWNSQLRWQPIPIHTRPFYEDAVVSAYKGCKKYERLYEAYDNSTESLERKNVTLMAYLKKHTGHNVTKFMDFIEVHDTLFVEVEDFGFPLPKWAEEIYPDTLNALSAFAFKSFTIEKEFAKLKMGPFFDEVTNNFINATKGDHYYKYQIYSGHDLNIANILTSLDVYNDIRPPYASAVVMELRQNRTNSSDHYINILYKNSTVAEPPVKITLPGCDFDCNFHKFKDLTAGVRQTLAEHEKECEDKNFTRAYEALFHVPYQLKGRLTTDFLT